MNGDATTAWEHGRHLTGRVRQLSVVVAGRRLPVTAPRSLSTAGFADDEHTGGAERAVFAYPAEHDADWDDARPAGGHVLPHFGENLTCTGLLETEVFVGDTFRWGTAEVQVTAPAVPDGSVDAQLAERQRRSGRTGFYLRVVRSGQAGPTDPLELIDVESAGVSLATVGVALLDGPAAAGVTPQRLLLLRDVLPPISSRSGRTCCRSLTSRNLRSESPRRAERGRLSPGSFPAARPATRGVGRG